MENQSVCANKHAYLIIAHANPYVLEKLILSLDDERNDIYIHIDKRVKNFDFIHFQSLPEESTLHFVERVDVYWGHVSQIEVELKLFKAAYESGSYSYFHLISGADLPIKSQNYIHEFFLQNLGKEFIGFSNDNIDIEKVNKKHLFPKHMRVGKSDFYGRLLRKSREFFLQLQRLLNYNYASKTEMTFVYGSNWVSITSGLVAALLKHEEWFLNFYKYSSCADEIYKHTFVFNSDYKAKVYSIDDELKSCMRYMDWQRGRPYTFRAEDFEDIMGSEMLFARKFEDNIDEKIVNLISESVKDQQ